MQIAIVDSSRVVLQIIASLIEPRGHAVHAFTDSTLALDFVKATPAIPRPDHQPRGPADVRPRIVLGRAPARGGARAAARDHDVVGAQRPQSGRGPRQRRRRLHREAAERRGAQCAAARGRAPDDHAGGVDPPRRDGSPDRGLEPACLLQPGPHGGQPGRPARRCLGDPGRHRPTSSASTTRMGTMSETRPSRPWPT